MHLLCPNCGGTQFYYDKLSEQTDPNDPASIIIVDHMRCKNRPCSFEFNIMWFSYIREEWLQLFSETKYYQHRKRNDIRDTRYNGSQKSNNKPR